MELTEQNGNFTLVSNNQIEILELLTGYLSKEFRTIKRLHNNWIDFESNEQIKIHEEKFKDCCDMIRSIILKEYGNDDEIAEINYNRIVQ